MAGTAGTVLPWMLLLMASYAAAAVQLRVEYPQEAEGNYSHVRLSCTQGGDFPDPLPGNQRPATFLRNDSVLSASDFVSLEAVDEMDAVEIVFTVEQEGEFFCSTGGTAPVENSSILYLAGVSSLQ